MPGQVLSHEWVCPIAIADCAQQHDDLEWLANHPSASHRSRPADTNEQLVLRVGMGISRRTTRRARIWVRLAAARQRFLVYVIDNAIVGFGADLEPIPDRRSTP